MTVSAGVAVNCVPMRVKFDAEGATVSWCFDDGLEFDDPFFDDSVRRCMRRPFNRAFMPRTPIAALTEFADTHGGRPPDAFIFHMSRCGSTLLAQMFTALPDTRVISESTAIDKVLYADRMIGELPVDTQVEWLRALVRSYGVRPHAPFARHVVKLDAWHIERLPLIERAFPDVPWIFLFRNPLEVLVSNLAQRAAATIPSVASHVLPGVDLLTALGMRNDHYLALILQHHMRTALQHRSSPRAIYVNYADLPATALPAILGHFGMALQAAEIERMLAKAARDAKQPAAAFVADAQKKQDAASPALRDLCANLLMPAFDELEALRWRPCR